MEQIKKIKPFEIKDISDVFEDTSLDSSSIIKVVGVGGAGGTAVQSMFTKGLEDVSFLICNTDKQDLETSTIPNKLLMGPEVTNGLGAGSRPEVAQQAAEASREDIKALLNDGTRMVFITAGMGGGTGTGASPVIAKVARELNLLTIAIVTLPFKWEGRMKMIKALKGVYSLEKEVDSIILIENSKLLKCFPTVKMREGFEKSNEILYNATKSIAEMITKPNQMNVDFKDVDWTLRDGGAAVINYGRAGAMVQDEKDTRIERAITAALDSPLISSNDIANAKRFLINLSCSPDQVNMEELNKIEEFMEKMSPEIETITGMVYDTTMGDEVQITILASGGGMNVIPDNIRSELRDLEEVGNLDLSKGQKVSTKIQSPRNRTRNSNNQSKSEKDIISDWAELLTDKPSKKPQKRLHVRDLDLLEGNDRFFKYRDMTAFSRSISNN